MKNNITTTASKYLIAMLSIALTMLAASCSEERHEPLNDTGGITGNIENVKVTPSPGGGIITYSVPKESNFLYVEADVYTPEGKIRNFKASSYTDTLKIFGLGSEKKHDIKIYAVNKGGQKTSALELTLEPETPPYKAVLKTVELKEAFGGVRIHFENEFKSDVAYILCKYNRFGELVEYAGHYSQEEEGIYTFRGLESTKTDFALYIRDQWDNISDTIFATLTPMFETRIDPTDSRFNFKQFKLLNDAPEHNQWNIKMEYLWDDAYSQDWNNPYMDGTNKAYLSYSLDVGNTIEPQWFTFDMGALAKISRFRVHHYWRYIMTGARKWEMWGRPDEPPLDGSIDGWYKLCDMEQKKPSGLPGETPGAGDVENWIAGTNADADQEIPPVRYIRVRAIEDWTGFAGWTAAEILIWGEPK